MAPQNVGIKAIELYFPSRYVAQSDLENFLGASTGKYTIGLGQTNMSFCDDREDIYSLALTTVSSLLRKYNIPPSSIGHLEVGTESMLDKAKSCKSVLMQLFGSNTDIEGADTYNACYGGTSALLNAVNWIESSAWDGRNAIVVASDIALYKTVSARPTGGAGCVAMLIGPDAPLVLEPLRASYMQHTYDFYKPDFKSEYPIVDGHYSSRCYLQALDGCYRRYREKQVARKANGMMNGVANGHSEKAGPSSVPLDEFDYFVFHAPNCKLVSKSYARLLYNDYIANPHNKSFNPDVVPSLILEQSYEDSLSDKALEKLFIKLSKERFSKRVQQSLTAPTMCGNMYTAGVYSGLISLLSNVPSSQLLGRRVGVYSFGSGLASTLFSLRVVDDVSDIVSKVDLHARLAARERVSPKFYDEMCELREKAYQQKSYTPVGSVDALAPGTYYLVEVDEMFRRTYAVKEDSGKSS
ncbi:Hydroxymethylglutaryl-CoA synthase [Penicillium subrubescens]|uniref:Hydroxymethylglutaryl-CoA synthase n=1 Tax=Penicillium subrubescens TaxID=1316194 RepID=UPI0025451F0A|nr:Hydroxymethylglutaryl-CoA synthase [Penicillium subrubescens]KAJ5883489.1 Hydroxymethylglutaryl-CoA synthase [Penicillium subrubescens]